MKTEVKGKVIQYEVKKRTFEGIKNPTKNDDALTSKYMPSLKYIAFYTVETDDNNQYKSQKSYKTKKEAEEDMKIMSQSFRIW